MQDATIKGEQEAPLLRERFPSVVDTDDLVFEMGKLQVKNLNFEKLLNSLVEKNKGQINTIDVLSKEKAVALAQSHEFKESNKLYENNNRELGDVVVSLRDEISSLKDSLNLLEASKRAAISDMKDELKKMKELERVGKIQQGKAKSTTKRISIQKSKKKGLV